MSQNKNAPAVAESGNDGSRTDDDDKPKQGRRRGNQRRKDNDNDRNKSKLEPANKSKKLPDYHVVKQPKDEKLGDVQDDPPSALPKRLPHEALDETRNPLIQHRLWSDRIFVFMWARIALRRSTLLPLKHDDVVIVPELFGAQDDWSLYYTSWWKKCELCKSRVPREPNGSRGMKALTSFVRIQREAKRSTWSLIVCVSSSTLRSKALAFASTSMPTVVIGSPFITILLRLIRKEPRHKTIRASLRAECLRPQRTTRLEEQS